VIQSIGRLGRSATAISTLVFIVTAGADGVVVKQALPYVRLVCESWPLPLDRAHFEHEALKIQTAYVPMHVPKVYR
jgi:5-methylthioribose kinase